MDGALLVWAFFQDVRLMRGAYVSVKGAQYL